MNTYIVYVASGEVLGAVEAEDEQTAASGIVNAVEWPGDPFAAEVNVARVTDEDAHIGDEVDPTDPHIEVVEQGMRVAIEN